MMGVWIQIMGVWILASQIMGVWLLGVWLLDRERDRPGLGRNQAADQLELKRIGAGARTRRDIEAAGRPAITQNARSRNLCLRSTTRLSKACWVGLRLEHNGDGTGGSSFRVALNLYSK